MWVRCLGVNKQPVLINLTKVFSVGLVGTGDQWAVAAHYSEETAAAAADVTIQMMQMRAKRPDVTALSATLLTSYLPLAEAITIHKAIGAAMAKGIRVLDLLSR